jgi:hypothetical protein
MTAPLIWRIQSGVLAFTDVDPLAVGYLPSWMGPGGATSATAAMADYEADSTFWSCQVTSGALTPTASTLTQDQPSTFCQLGETVPTPTLSTWTLDVEMIQDPHVGGGVAPAQAMGLAEYLYDHDAKEVFFLLGLNGPDAAPRAIGRVVLSAATFGGVAQDILLATGSWPTSGKPDIAFGQSVITPTGLVVQTAGGEKSTKSDKAAA